MLKQWEAIKRDEKKSMQRSLSRDLRMALPALMRAQKFRTKVARVNFGLENNLGEVMAKVEEELGETKTAHRNRAMKRPSPMRSEICSSPSSIWRGKQTPHRGCAASRDGQFLARFNQLEDDVRAQGKQLGEVGLEELDAIWNRVKKIVPS